MTWYIIDKLNWITAQYKTLLNMKQAEPVKHFVHYHTIF